MECPVCAQDMITPKLYDCGHSVCELCMIKMDLNAAEEAHLNTLPLFRCPVCRTATFNTFHTRPLNHALCEIIEVKNARNVDFLSQKIEYEREFDEIMQSDKYRGSAIDIVSNGRSSTATEAEVGWSTKGNAVSLNLAAISKTVRNRRALDLFDKLMPRLHEAACRGAMRLVITTRARELAEMAKEIARLIFPFGVHSVTAHPREFTVNFLQDEVSRFGWTGSGEYVNESYVEPVDPPAVVLVEANEEHETDDDRHEASAMALASLRAAAFVRGDQEDDDF